MSTAFSGFPSDAPPTGYHFLLQARDSGSSGGQSKVELSKNNGVASAQCLLLELNDEPDDRIKGIGGYVPCDANGDVYISITATGANTLDIWLTVTGFTM